MTHTAAPPSTRALAVGLVLAVTLVAFETTAVITALPTITDELGGDSLYGAALSAYLLADLVALVAASEAADRRGPRLPFTTSVGVFVAGLAVAAAAPTMPFVVLGRVLQGAGAGGLASISYVVVRRAFPERRQPVMYAFLSAGWVLPSLIAPAIAGMLTDTSAGGGCSGASCRWPSLWWRSPPRRWPISTPARAPSSQRRRPGCRRPCASRAAWGSWWPGCRRPHRSLSSGSAGSAGCSPGRHSVR